VSSSEEKSVTIPGSVCKSSEVSFESWNREAHHAGAMMATLVRFSKRRSAIESTETGKPAEVRLKEKARDSLLSHQLEAGGKQDCRLKSRMFGDDVPPPGFLILASHQPGDALPRTVQSDQPHDRPAIANWAASMQPPIFLPAGLQPASAFATRFTWWC
jgi:hypothetical protein